MVCHPCECTPEYSLLDWAIADMDTNLRMQRIWKYLYTYSWMQNSFSFLFFLKRCIFASSIFHSIPFVIRLHQFLIVLLIFSLKCSRTSMKTIQMPGELMLLTWFAIDQPLVIMFKWEKKNECWPIMCRLFHKRQVNLSKSYHEWHRWFILIDSVLNFTFHSGQHISFRRC